MRRALGVQVMAGAPIAASFLAHAIFWILLGYGALWGDLRTGWILAFVGLWFVVYLAAPLVFFDPFAMVRAALVAFLDIVLVLILFKGDVRLT